MINEQQSKERFFQDILDFVRIPSRSFPEGGEEGALQAEMARRMSNLGARVRTFSVADVPGFRHHRLCHGPERDYTDRPTVIGEVGPNHGPALLILAHSDTVEAARPEEWTVDPFTGTIRDNMLVGLGSGDDKWGLAVMLMILAQLRDRNRLQSLPKRLIFASTMDEENGVCNGTLLLMLAEIQAEAALYLDGRNMNVCIGCNGGSNLYLHPRSRPAPELQDRHSRVLAEMAEQMSNHRAALYEQPFFEHNIIKNSSVQFRDQTRDNSRFFIFHFYNPPGEDREVFCRQLETSIREALGKDFSGYSMSYREPWFEPALIPEETPIVRHLTTAIADVTGRPGKLATISKQDSFLLTNHAGIPTVSFGVSQAVDPGGAHTPDEAINCDQAWQGCLAADQAVNRWLDD